ncbi:MAG: sulfatase-like hydrolase/transferase [Candidatus Eisenbacteria sp.]|nr:sulfatase-like hydrolase/transferase [Candidatus Eisenbacteria bacterium]
MTGRNLSILLVLFLVPAFLSPGCAHKPEARITNLVLIVIDTLRSDHLGCYGYPCIQTPVIDGMARNGTLFEQAITPVPVTNPAFASLLTSTYPPTHGIRDNGLFTLAEDMVTLAEVLEEEGFSTAAFLGSAVMDSIYGLGQGFHIYDDHFESDYVPCNLEYLSLAEELRTTQRRADAVTRNALSWIKRNRQNRFFVMLHLFDPHACYDPPPPFDSLYAGSPYDGEIAYTDYQIGRFLDAIGAFEIPGRTLIVLTSDHGEGLMDHEESQHGLLIYDSTLRVPMIFTCPEVCPRAARVFTQVSLVDIAPTVLPLLGVKTPEDFQGSDLSPIFEGSPVQRPDAAYCETYRPRLSYGWSHLQGIRTVMWKYIRAPEPELYDLIRDRGETTNLSGTGLSIEEVLVEQLDELIASFPASEACRPTEVPRDETTRERLASLGYLSGMSGSRDAEGQMLPNPRSQMEAFNRCQLASRHTRTGWALLESGDPGGALDAFLETLRIEPGSPLRHVNLAAAYVRLEQYERAASVFRDALKLDPAYVNAHLGLARMYRLRGDVGRAVQAYERALEVNPDHEDALAELVRLQMDRGRPDAVVPILEDILRQDPDNTRVLYLLVETLRQTGNYEGAVPHLKELTRLQPLNPDPPFFLGHTLTRLGLLDEAAHWYERAVQLDPRMVDACYNIACIRSRQNRRAEALDWLERAVEDGFVEFTFMQRDPDLEPLRGDARFRALFRGE